MFSLTDHQVKICSFNPRAEKHGEDNVLAGDLKLEATCHSSVLDHFDKTWRKFLYRKPAPGEQTEIEFKAEDGLTQRRMPNLAPFKLDEDFPGYHVSIVSGLAIEETLLLNDVELSNFVFEALDGGSVQITFRASFRPDGRTSGKLCQLIQETVELTLTPPEREAEQKGMAA